MSPILSQKLLTVQPQVETIQLSDKEVAPAVRQHPEARPPGGHLMVVKSLAEECRDERRRMILREAEVRFNHELMDDKERQLLLDRIRRLRRTLGILAR
jgi:hypothetical protein